MVRLITLLFLAITIPASASDFYTWRDSDGHLHVTDKRPNHTTTSDEMREIKERNYDVDDHRQPSETFQQRVYDQIDTVNEHRYQDASEVDDLQRKKEKREFEKTVDVERKMLEERIHYYKFRCAKITDAPNRKEWCDSRQKLYEEKLELLNQDPEEYFMRETRH